MYTRLNGEALQEARSVKGLTRHQLALRVDLRQGEQILRLELGVDEPNARMLRTLAEALSVQPMQLLSLPNGVDLRALRLSSGLSAEELAQVAHVSVRSYLKWEAGESLPLQDERILSALAGTLGVSPDQLMSVLHRGDAPPPSRPAETL